MASSNPNDGIDHDLIDSLLDEFDQSSSSGRHPTNQHTDYTACEGKGTPPAVASATGPDHESLNAIFENLLRSMPDEESRRKPENLQESLQEAARMINSQSGSSGFESREEDENELIRKLMEEFQIGSESNIEESVEKLMSQMLSAETLQDPVKQVTAMYPQWLAEHSSSISDSERSNYESQYEVFKKMCLMFESGEAGSNEIMDMMTEVQRYGQPPKEIIQALVPGLEFNQEGEPILKDLPPELAGLTGEQPNCSLM